MGYIISDYDDSVRRPFNGKLDVWAMNPLKPYMKHYANYLLLQFMVKRGTRQEQYQALKELKVCDRKLKFWSQHPKWDSTAAANEVLKMKAQWDTGK